jgi:hypothetical protein
LREKCETTDQKIYERSEQLYTLLKSEKKEVKNYDLQKVKIIPNNKILESVPGGTVFLSFVLT